jgi:hypothetical protein
LDRPPTRCKSCKILLMAEALGVPLLGFAEKILSNT